LTLFITDPEHHQHFLKENWRLTTKALIEGCTQQHKRPRQCETEAEE